MLWREPTNSPVLVDREPLDFFSSIQIIQVRTFYHMNNNENEHCARSAGTLRDFIQNQLWGPTSKALSPSTTTPRATSFVWFQKGNDYEYKGELTFARLVLPRRAPVFETNMWTSILDKSAIAARNGTNTDSCRSVWTETPLKCFSTPTVRYPGLMFRRHQLRSEDRACCSTIGCGFDMKTCARSRV